MDRKLGQATMTAVNPRMGLTLRLLGPMVECLCLFALMRYGSRGTTILGRPIEPMLYAGLGCGLAMVVVGLLVSRSAIRRPHEES